MFFRKHKHNIILGSLIFATLSVASGQGVNAQTSTALLGPGWYDVRADPMSLEQAQQELSARPATLSPVEMDQRAVASAAFATPQDYAALAAALENDPLRIYQYVRNHFEYVPYYGALKGPYLTLLDRSGNDFDQAALLVELLRAAGYDAKFRFGTVTVDTGNPLERKKLADWLGTDENAELMVNFLASLGGPVGTNSDFTTIQFGHVWVEVTVDGEGKSLDPSFKRSSKSTTIDLDTAMGYSQSGVLSAAGGTFTADSIEDIDESGLDGYLTTLSTQLQTYLAQNHPNATVDEVLGGFSIIPENLAALPTELPLSVISMQAPWDTIPSSYVHTINIVHGGINVTLDIPKIAGRKVSFNYSGSSKIPQLRIDDVIVKEGNPAAATVPLFITVNHPYSSAGANQQSDYSLKSSARYVLVSGFGGDKHSTLLGERQRQLGRMSILGTSVTARSRVTETLNVMGLTWMQQTQLNADMLGATTGKRQIVHHRFGIVAEEAGYYIDVRSQVVSDLERTVAAKEGSFVANGFISSAMEHSVLEQTQSASNPAVSTIKLIALNNSNSGRLFLANNANYPSIRLALEQHGTYSAGKLNSFQSLVNDNHRLLIPENGALNLNAWTGLGYVDYLVSGESRGLAMIIGGGLNGGYVSQPQPVDPVATQAESYLENLQQSYIDPTPAQDPVDLGTGAFISDMTDIGLGGAGVRGLQFTRSYNSQQVTRDDAGLGRGWSHNYHGAITEHSSVDLALGGRTPFDAIAFIVANHVARSMVEPLQPSIRNWAVAAMTANWAMEQLLNKTVSVQAGSRVLSYQELPDGTFTTPPGVTTTLTRLGSGDYRLDGRFGDRTRFNSNKRLSWVRDADGKQLNFTYSGDQLMQVSDAYGRTLTLGYSGNALNSVSDSTGRSVSYTNTSGNLTNVIGLENASWDYGYDSLHRLETVNNPVEVPIVDNTYNDFDRVIQQIAPRETGPETYKFYYAGFLSSEEHSEEHRTTYHYDVNGRKVAIENALGDIARFTYDGQGHQTTATDPRGYTTTFVYDGNQNLEKQINDSDKSVDFQYDGMYRLDFVLDQLSHKTDFGFDAEHHLISVKDALLNEVVTTYYPSGPSDGLVDTVKDARQTVTKFVYDAQGYLDTSKVGAHPVLNPNYNTRGFLNNVVDQESATTSFLYDTRGLVTTRTDALGKKNISKYNAAGQLWHHTDRNLDVVTIDYTDTGKLDVIDYPGPTAVNFDYDAQDNLEEMTDASGTTMNTFDAVNRLSGHTDPNGHGVGYAYDAAGNLQTLTYPGGKTVTYGYDNLNRLATVTINWLGGEVMTYDYDDANRLEGIDHFNGLYTDVQFDAANRLTGLVLSGNGVLASYTYIPDPNGNRKTETINAEPIKPAGLINDTVSFNYNSQRNRLQSTTDHSYDYDFEGQQTSKDATVYDFDYAHRLVQIGTTTFFTYDGVGNRISATRDGTVTEYIYDAAGNLLAEADGAGQITRYYIYGLGLTAMVTASGELYVYHFDGTGHAVAMTNSAKEPVNKYAYSPYGEVLGKYEQVPQPFKYAGQVGIFTEADNLYYMRARYYDAETGRFISEDPAGFIDGPNLYAYVGGNPIGAVDPTGLVTQQEINTAIQTLQTNFPDVFPESPASVTPVPNLVSTIWRKPVVAATSMTGHVRINANDYGDINSPLDPILDQLFLETIAHEMLHVQENIVQHVGSLFSHNGHNDRAEAMVIQVRDEYRNTVNSGGTQPTQVYGAGK